VMRHEVLAHALGVDDDASPDAEQGWIGRCHPRMSLVALEQDGYQAAVRGTDRQNRGGDLLDSPGDALVRGSRFNGYCQAQS
jgi:hypothetical protein